MGSQHWLPLKPGGPPRPTPTASGTSVLGVRDAGSMQVEPVSSLPRVRARENASFASFSYFFQAAGPAPSHVGGSQPSWTQETKPHRRGARVRGTIWRWSALDPALHADTRGRGELTRQPPSPPGGRVVYFRADRKPCAEHVRVRRAESVLRGVCVCSEFHEASESTTDAAPREF